MNKIYVLHENNEWTQHLKFRLDELSLPYELWHLDEGALDLTSVPPKGVFYNRVSASSHTRDHQYAPHFTSSTLSWLESHNRLIINGSRALELEVSKIKQYLELNKFGINTPKTIAAIGKENILKSAYQLGKLPFITKHNCAGKGQGVFLFETIDALEKYLNGNEFDQPVDGITLIQEYIKSPEPFIIRHEFINGKFFYAVKVDTSEGFELCPADACSIEDIVCPASTNAIEGKVEKQNISTIKDPKFQILSNYHPEFIESYENFLMANNIQVAGIENIIDENGNIYTYDVNTNTNYNSDAELAVNKYAMLELAKFLGEKLKLIE